MCECCGKCFIFSFYLIVLLVGSFFTIALTFCSPFSFPDNSIFKNDKILFENNYHYLSDFPDIQQLYQNYSNDIYYKRKYDFNNSYNIAVVPIFMVLSIIFAASFICHSYDKIIFFFVGLFTVIIQVIPLLNKIYSIKQKKKLPEIEIFSSELYSIYQAYKDYREQNPNYMYIILIVLLSIQLIICFFLLIFKKEDPSNLDNRKKKLARCTLIFHSVFGITSTIIFIFSSYLFYPCKNRYSNNFLPDKYSFIKTQKVWISNYYSREYNLTIEEYDYEDYPYLKEIYNIYYKNISKETLKVEVDFKNLGIIYFFLAIAAMPLLGIISFILLICFKCKEKGHKGFIFFEILSMLLKLCIIFWPFIWIKNKFRKDLVNTKEEIKYIIDDYINYSKCRNTFPVIMIIECIYVFFELIIFIISFAGNNDSSNKPVPLPISESVENYQNEDRNKQNQTVIYRDRIIMKEVEHKHVLLKFKDNNNHKYELDVDVKRRFRDALNELIGKYEYLRKNEILSVVLENRYLFLKNISVINNRCLETIEQLNINNNIGFIKLEVVEQRKDNVNISQNNETLNLNKPKLPPLPKLRFCFINLENRIIELERNENLIFNDILENLRKKDEELPDIIFESIYYRDRMEKIEIEGQKLNKKLNELNIPKDSIIFVKTNFKDNTPINFEFIWVNENYKRYNFSAGKKQKFHSVAIDFIGTFNEFINKNIITKYYIYKSDNNQNLPTNCIKENVNILTTENQNIEILEMEYNCNFNSLEDLGIGNGSEIFFETIPNMFANTLQKSNILTSYLFFDNFRNSGNILINFRTSRGGEGYPLSVNEKETLEEVLIKLKREYKIFQENEIIGVALRGETLSLEEKRKSQIKDLNITSNDYILIAIK